MCLIPIYSGCQDWSGLMFHCYSLLAATPAYPFIYEWLLYTCPYSNESRIDSIFHSTFFLCMVFFPKPYLTIVSLFVIPDPDVMHIICKGFPEPKQESSCSEPSWHSACHFMKVVLFYLWSYVLSSNIG